MNSLRNNNNNALNDTTPPQQDQSLWDQIKNTLGFTGLRTANVNNPEDTKDFVLELVSDTLNLNQSGIMPKIWAFFGFLLWVFFSLASLLQLTIINVQKTMPFLSNISLINKIKSMIPTHFLFILSWVSAYLVIGLHRSASFFLLLLSSVITISYSFSLKSQKYIMLTAGLIQLLFSLLKLGFLNMVFKNQMILTFMQFSTTLVVILLIVDFFIMKRSSKGMGRGNIEKNNSILY